MEYFETLDWANAKAAIEPANKELAQLLDGVAKTRRNADNLPKFVMLRYPYGDTIVKDGRLVFPSGLPESKHKHATQCTLCDKHLPLCIILNERCVEILIDVEEDTGQRRCTPTNLLDRGKSFGVWEAIDRMIKPDTSNFPPWSVMSGARSVHLLLPIATGQGQRAVSPGYTRLQNCRKIKDLLRTAQIRFTATGWKDLERDSWPLVKAIANAVDGQWYVEILVVPSEWISAADDASLKLQRYLLIHGWEQSAHLRNAPSIEASIQKLMVQSHYDIKLGIEYMPHLKRIISIGQGEGVAFRPVCSDESRGPFPKCLEYLRPCVHPYIPAMLEPTYLQEGECGYYSASIPTVPVPAAEMPRNAVYAFHKKLFKLWDEEHAPEQDGNGPRLQKLKDHGFDWDLYGKPSSDKLVEGTDILMASALYNVFVSEHQQCIDPNSKCLIDRFKNLPNPGEPPPEYQCPADARECPVSQSFDHEHLFFEACVEITRD